MKKELRKFLVKVCKKKIIYLNAFHKIAAVDGKLCTIQSIITPSLNVSK
jgi:hypothetical protein